MYLKNLLESYGLDSCDYFSSPELSWDAMLKMTGTELELISDNNMHLFIEKRMEGVISYIAKKFSKANNKYMKSYYNCKENIRIKYLDVNNSYG